MPPASEGRREQKPVGRPLRARIPIRADEVPLMTERFFDFWRVDVFTDTPLTGNPLAVFPRATGLSTVEMAGVAREMNLSETTFVFPSTNPAAHYRNRIFTPGGEIPFAGHPSIGTAFVAAMEGLVPHPDGSSVVYQELEIGVLPLIDLRRRAGEESHHDPRRAVARGGDQESRTARIGPRGPNERLRPEGTRSPDRGDGHPIPPSPPPIDRPRERVGSGPTGPRQGSLQVR